MCKIRHIPAFLLFMAGLGAARPAFAVMDFCNRTDAPVEAAFGYRETLDWVSQGWWHIDPGQCARVFGRPLTQRFYFYFARSLAKPPPGKKATVWAGKYQFCIDARPFHVTGDTDCVGRGFITQGFKELDIGQGTRDYVLSFQEKAR